MKKNPIVVKRYESDKEYQKDYSKMIARGYDATSIVTEQPRAGCGRIIALGIFAFLFKPKPVIIVTYKLNQ